MGFFDRIKEKGGDFMDKMNKEVAKVKNKSFLDCVMAACAAVAYADGEVTADEKQKMIGFINTNPSLRVFDQKKAIDLFNGWMSQFEFDATIGLGAVTAKLASMKGKPEAPLIVSVCCAVGAADGNFDDDEKAVARKLAAAMGLSPSDFDL